MGNRMLLGILRSWHGPGIVAGLGHVLLLLQLHVGIQHDFPQADRKKTPLCRGVFCSFSRRPTNGIRRDDIY